MSKLYNHPYVKKLKQNPTKCEKKFYTILQKELNNKDVIKNQYPIKHSRGFYIIDFYLPSFKIGFEIDGGYHWLNKQIDYDLKRKDYLKEKYNIDLFTFPNSLIEANKEEVKSNLRTLLEFGFNKMREISKNGYKKHINKKQYWYEIWRLNRKLKMPIKALLKDYKWLLPTKDG